MNNINSIIIEHLKNPVLLSDYAYITESSKGKNKLSIRTRTPQAIINLGLTKLPEKGLYILHHPIFSLFYLDYQFLFWNYSIFLREDQF